MYTRTISLFFIHFPCITRFYFAILVNLNGFILVQLLVISFILIYLFIYAIFNVLGGGKESRTPDLLLARQAL